MEWFVKLVLFLSTCSISRSLKSQEMCVKESSVWCSFINTIRGNNNGCLVQPCVHQKMIRSYLMKYDFKHTPFDTTSSDHAEGFKMNGQTYKFQGTLTAWRNCIYPRFLSIYRSVSRCQCWVITMWFLFHYFCRKRIGTCKCGHYFCPHLI